MAISNINVFQPHQPNSHTLKVVTKRIRFNKANPEVEEIIEGPRSFSEVTFTNLEEVQNYIKSMTQRNESFKKAGMAMPDSDGNCYYLASFLEK